jgi:hypothetical protein
VDMHPVNVFRRGSAVVERKSRYVNLVTILRLSILRIQDLMLIVDNFEVGFQSSSRKKRALAAFKVATHSNNIQRFRESLNETKTTLTLALVHERYAIISRNDL